MYPVSRAAGAVLLLTSAYACASTAPQANNCEGAIYPDPTTTPYVLPFEIGTERYLSQSNCDGFHNELDWFAYDFDMPIGTTVLAAREGVVAWVQEEYEDGDHDFFHSNTVQITHFDGSFAQYLHLTLNGALVEVGERVVHGQPIGISGFTGMTGPREHLHFVVFEFLNADGRKSLPTTFRNVSGPQPLIADRSYRALLH